MNCPLYPNVMYEMARHGDTQKSLAQKLGISSGTVSKKLRGISNFELLEIKQILELYDADFKTLFDSDPPKNS